MTFERPVTEEPRLTVRPRQAPFLLRRPFLPWFAFVTVLALLLGTLLVRSGNLMLPLERITTLHGKAASKADFFEDSEVRRILMRHNIWVDMTKSETREILLHDIDQYDFVFPSGGSSAELIKERQAQKKGSHVGSYTPFITPLVLATYREYADVLQDAGIVSPQQGQGQAAPLYYRIKMRQFLDLTKQGKRWSELGVRHKVNNENKMLAHTPDICETNSGGAYLGMVAFLENNNDVVKSENEARVLAGKIRPTVTAMGLPATDIFEIFIKPEGKGIAPVVVVYEHQYLEYQLNQQASNGKPDSSRVLLYPDPSSMSQPMYISLNEKADDLGELLHTDPALRRRAVELGYRLVDHGGGPSGPELTSLLSERHVPPVPDDTAFSTNIRMPTVANLETMIVHGADCQPIDLS